VTLIELLVVMVIIAILASIAVPTYRNYVLRAQRTDATRGLLAIQGAEEKYFLQNSVYTDNLSGAPPAGLGMLSTSENGLYNFSVALLAAGSAFTARAVPSSGGGQTDDTKCRLFTVDQTGQRHAEDAGGADKTSTCWR
jgi:type IV pilus assembly protein PilE